MFFLAYDDNNKELSCMLRIDGKNIAYVVNNFTSDEYIAAKLNSGYPHYTYVSIEYALRMEKKFSGKIAHRRVVEIFNDYMS